MSKKKTDQTKPTAVYSYATFDGPKELREKIKNLDAKNFHVVFYNPNEEVQVKSFSRIEPCKSKNGKPFYGMKASRYGAKVPANATHMSIAIFGGEKIERLYDMTIPAPHSKIIVNFGSNFIMTVRRSNTNIFVALGDTLYIRSEINKMWVTL